MHEQEPIDYSKGLLEFANNEVIFKQSLQQFVRSLPIYALSLREYLAREDYQGIRAATHKLCGAALNITAYPIGRIAEELNEKLDVLSNDEINKSIEQLEEAIDQIQKYVQNKNLL